MKSNYKFIKKLKYYLDPLKFSMYIVIRTLLHVFFVVLFNVTIIIIEKKWQITIFLNEIN